MHRTPMRIQDYVCKVEPTDKLPQEELYPVLMGLFGEVGSLMSTIKKRKREQHVYIGYTNTVEEEFGDVLWYFTALSRRLNIKIDTMFSACTAPADAGLKLDQDLLELGKAAAELLNVDKLEKRPEDMLHKFSRCYCQVLQAAGLKLPNILHSNYEKVRGRFLEPNETRLPIFDIKFAEEERFPRHFKIEIIQRKSGESHMRWNGVFIGDPLTDNSYTQDGYRFHDVFHLAYAAILHWSPTFRALIKQKRKSNPKMDEVEDGGRAIVIEEGLTAWIFSHATQSKFFNEQESLPFDLLKTVQQFVKGYEVEKCPLKLWERAILDGYKVFRQVRHNGGGIVIGNLEHRTIKYKPLEGKQK